MSPRNKHLAASVAKKKKKTRLEPNAKMSRQTFIKVCYGAGAEVLPPHLQSFFLWYFTKSLSVKGRQWEEKREERLIFFKKNGWWKSAEKKQKQLLILWLKVGQYIKGGSPQKGGKEALREKRGRLKRIKTQCFVLPMTDGCFLFYFIMHISAAT